MQQNTIESCFVCNQPTISQLCIASLSTQKSNTQYVALIGEFISNDCELHVTTTNKICLECQAICERYDELMFETRKTKAVLARQMAATYSLNTEEYFYIDTASLYNKTTTISNTVQFTCRSCKDFKTLCPSTADKHFVYHEIMEAKEKEKKSTQPPPAQRRESKQHESSTSQAQQPTRTYTTKKWLQPTFEERIMNQLIDIEYLEDPLSDSNVRLSKCVISNCGEEFLHLCDYVHHLKFNHKASLNQIFTIIRANIKKPKKLSKHCCPFCFSKASTETSLIEHVKLHEDSTGNVFTERLNTFISNLIAQAKCGTCGFERSDTSHGSCSHEKVKDKENAKLNCKHCDAFFFKKILLNNHLAEVHNECFACNTTHKQRLALTKHLHQHVSQSDHKCPFNCKNILRTKKSLQDHVKFKHPDKCCKHCNEWFVDLNTLNQHVRYSHANLKSDEKPSICDHCGDTFKNLELLNEHIKSSHPNPSRMFLCSICRKATFKYRYQIFEHMANDHQRKIADNNDAFYKCFLCPKTFTSCNRPSILNHFIEHTLETTFCTDCNTIFENLEELEAHRSKVHLDFSVLINKMDPLKVLEIQESEQLKANPQPTVPKIIQPEPAVAIETATENNIAMKEYQQQLQTLIQSDDGTILNNLMVNENGELIVPNYAEGMIQNGHDLEASQIQQIEQFLLEQGITDTSGISYIQTEDGQILLQQTTDENNDDQEAIMHLLQSQQDDAAPQEENNCSSEMDIEVDTPKITINPENQAALDELGDILLEVAAAADNDNSFKGPTSKSPQKRRNNGSRFADEEPVKRFKTSVEETQPVKNFSQAYEYFVKGFDAMRNKI